MNTRLQEIILYKTGGKQTLFAQQLGWTPQYLKKLLNGENFGLQPVLRLLSAFPEISARWLLFGEGQMFSTDTGRRDLQQELHSHIQTVLELERCLPYMEPEELREFEEAVIRGAKPVFSPETVAKWTARADERERYVNAKFAEAQLKSEETLCRQAQERR